MAADGVRQWLRAFEPAPVTVARREVFHGAFGAFAGLLCACWLSHRMLAGLPVWFIAPMGASAVLLFAVPASPLAQPWALVGGNLVSALIGVTCAAWVPDVALAASLAAGLSIAAMFALRCLHPPSGAVALTAVLGGPAVSALGYRFVLWPVAIDSLLLLLTALVFNVAARRRYPHRASAHPSPHLTRDEAPTTRLGLTAADLDTALRARGELLDVNREDLEELFIEAEHRAWRRRFGDIACADIMSHDVVTVQPATSAEQAWQLMLRHAVKALPVVDAVGRLEGIVTMHDFFVGHLASADAAPSRPEPSLPRVGEVMTTPVLAARPGQPIVDLIATFSDAGRNHLPVVDEHRRLVGMVTQSDMVAALFRAGLERRAA